MIALHLVGLNARTIWARLSDRYYTRAQTANSSIQKTHTQLAGVDLPSTSDNFGSGTRAMMMLDYIMTAVDNLFRAFKPAVPEHQQQSSWSLPSGALLYGQNT